MFNCLQLSTLQLRIKNDRTVRTLTLASQSQISSATLETFDYQLKSFFTLFDLDIMETPSDNDNSKDQLEEENKKSEATFKKPVLIGKIGRLPKKVFQDKKPNETKPQTEHSTCEAKPNTVATDAQTGEEVKPTKSATQTHAENEVPLSYIEPSWGGMPKSMENEYVLEVLKEGSIIETINLMNRSFWVFGRLNACNIVMQHPTISRFHAVLQFRAEGTDSEPSGFYIYDLGSTHGTFLNKNKLKPKVYVRIQVGHMLKLGCSTRTYLLNGPEYDEEDESELTVTELKQKRAEQVQKYEEEKLRREQEEEEQRRKEEERGIDWGLGEDADETTDLSVNPYAQTANEELYIADPKKALRGFFEREGLELTYDCQEHGMGQFQCTVELPLDDEMGRPIVAEVIHKGKKKEAVIQCALEACRILDSHGVLRQATHESRKRKAKNWEENDYYDSDEDTFLDRTGTIEKKREKRMNAKAPQKAETYETLLEKEKSISSSISDIEKQLSSIQTNSASGNTQSAEEDSLDSFMKELSDSKPHKLEINRLKRELLKLKAEHAKVIRLVNIAKPAELPPLVAKYESEQKEVKTKTMPMIGKRKKIKVQLPSKPSEIYVTNDYDDQEEEEENEEGQEKREELKSTEQTDLDKAEQQTAASFRGTPSTLKQEQIQEKPRALSPSSESDDEKNPTRFSIKKLENMVKKGLPPFAEKHKDTLEKIVATFNSVITTNGKMHLDVKTLAVKKRKVTKLLSDLKHSKSNEKMDQDVSIQLNNVLNDLKSMCKQESVVPEGTKIIPDADNKDQKSSGDVKPFKLKARLLPQQQMEDEDSSDDEGTNDEKRKRRNQRRIQQRQMKADKEKLKGYNEDANKEDYNMWVPPTDQSGDGRTHLNEKFGY